MKYFFLFFLFLFSCAPLKRHDRIVKKYPFVHTEIIDTLHDTTYIHSVKHDTVVNERRLYDTVRFEKERLRVQVVRVKDSVYIQGECKDTTIIKNIPYKVYTSTKQPFNFTKLIYFVLILVFIYFIVRLATNFKR